MNTDDEWDIVQDTRSVGIAEAGSGLLRVSLLFGSAAIALTLFLVPIMTKSTDSTSSIARNVDGIDQTSTGSIGNANEYVLRRSVLQHSPSSVCVINKGGKQSGDC